MSISYHLHRSHRKSLSIRILPNGEVRVSAPYLLSQSTIDHFVESKKKRIEKHLNNLPKWFLPQEKIIDKSTKEKALIQILPRIEYYATLMNLNTKYGTIKITNASTKRGSCSNTWNLMFHRKLSELPLFVLDYVIVHELAHLIYFNHSKHFWKLVEDYYPDYKETKKRLKENGHNRSIT